MKDGAAIVQVVLLDCKFMFAQMSGAYKRREDELTRARINTMVENIDEALGSLVPVKQPIKVCEAVVGG